MSRHIPNQNAFTFSRPVWNTSAKSDTTTTAAAASATPESRDSESVEQSRESREHLKQNGEREVFQQIYQRCKQPPGETSQGTTKGSEADRPTRTEPTSQGEEVGEGEEAAQRRQAIQGRDSIKKI